MASTKYVSLRNKLQRKIFDPYAKSVTLKSKDATTYNSRGEAEDQTYTESTVSMVPYNIMEQRQSYEAFGTMEEGDLDAAVPYDITVNQGDLVTIEGQDYEIKEVERNYLPENVVTIIRLTRVQA